MKKIILTSLFVVKCAVLSYIFITVGYTEPVKTALVSISVSLPEDPVSIEQKSAKGTWKQDNTGEWNFYCASDGSYQGHTRYESNGYWNTYEGAKQNTTFIDMPSAKRYIENKVAKCE